MTVHLKSAAIWIIVMVVAACGVPSLGNKATQRSSAKDCQGDSDCELAELSQQIIPCPLGEELTNLTIEGLRSYLKRQMSSQQAGSQTPKHPMLEEFLACLPSYVRESWFLIEDSQDEQRFPCTAERPCIGNFSPDYAFSLIVSPFGAGEDNADFNLEVAEVHLESNMTGIQGHTEFGVFHFPADEAEAIARAELPEDEQISFSNAREGGCTRCHGMGHQTKLRWGNYAEWENLYQRSHGPLDTDQAEHLIAIMKDPPPRYQHIIWNDSQFADNLRVGIDILSVPGQRYGYTNTLIGFRAGAIAAKSIYDKMRQHPKWNELREAFLLSRRSCSEDHWSDAHRRVAQILGHDPEARYINTDFLYRQLGRDPGELAIHIDAEDIPAQGSPNNATPTSATKIKSTNPGESSIRDLVDFLVLKELIDEYRPLHDAFSGISEYDALIDKYPEARYASDASSAFRYNQQSMLVSVEDRYQRVFGLIGNPEAMKRDGEEDSVVGLLRVGQHLIDPMMEPVCSFLAEQGVFSKPAWQRENDD